jgi:hypothetical protein
MAGLKTLLLRAEIDVALHSHRCRRNKNHLIARGQRRLKVRAGRSWKHYCLHCAVRIVERDSALLSALASAIKAAAGEPTASSTIRQL